METTRHVSPIEQLETESDKKKYIVTGVRSAGLLFMRLAIVLAPWMYGSTRHWAIIVLCQILTIVGACWLSTAWMLRRASALPMFCLFPVFFLFVSGWLVVLSGLRLQPDPFNTKHFADLAGRWPGSFMIKSPRETMWLFSGLFGALLLNGDPSTSAGARRQTFNLLVWVGGSVVLLGNLQQMFGVHSWLWDKDTPNAGSFFATFFEDSIGGSFITMIWPLAFGGLVGRICVPRSMYKSEVWLATAWAILMIVLLCGLPAEGSTFAMINSLVLGCVCLGWILWRLPLRDMRRLLRRGGIVFAACLIAFATVVSSLGKWATLKVRLDGVAIAFGKPSVTATQEAHTVRKRPIQMRADGLIESPTTEQENGGIFGSQRRKVALMCLRMVPSSGLLGFGPGTWSQTYPRFTDDTMLRTFYLQMQFAHQDYLQALVEWGVLGFVAWAMIFVGAIRAGVYRLRRYRGTGGAIGVEEGMVAGALFGLCGALLHAFGDFPLQVPSIQLYVAVLLGMLWATGSQRGILGARSRSASSTEYS